MAATLELAGFSTTIGSLSDGGVFPATGKVQNTLATGGNVPTVLTIAGTNGAAVGFGGTISQSGAGAAALVKNGAGTQSLSGQSQLQRRQPRVNAGHPGPRQPVAAAGHGPDRHDRHADHQWRQHRHRHNGTGGAINNSVICQRGAPSMAASSFINVVLSPAVLGAPERPMWACRRRGTAVVNGAYVHVPPAPMALFSTACSSVER